MQTLLPEPVVPAIRRCGISARSDTSASPDESLPRNRGIAMSCVFRGAICIRSLMRTFSFSLLGTSIPMVCLPRSGATTRTAPAPSALAISFASAEIWLTFTPADSSSSNIVMTGPVSASTTRAFILNSASSFSSASALASITLFCTAA